MVISQVEDYVLPVFDTSSPPAPAEKIKSTIDLIDFNAEHNPNALFCIQMEEHDVLLEISYKTFRDMISRSQAWVEENIHTVGRDESNKMSKPHSIALFMDSDVGLLAYLFALMGLGIPVLLLSTRLGPLAIQSLLQTTQTRSVITSHRLHGAVNEALASWPVQSDPMPRSYLPLLYSELLDERANSRAGIASATHYVSDEDRDVLILHTSGTTGLPKAIQQSHRYLLSYASLTSFEFDDTWTLRDEQRMTFSTLPLFHCYGLLAPMFSLSIGKPFAIPPPGRVPTAASTVQFIRTAGASSLVVVPSLLEDIVNFPQGMEALKELDYVKCGGGAIRPRIGEELHTSGIKIATGFGSTEIGSLSVFRPPSTNSDWRFFRLREDRHCSVERMDDLNHSQDGPLYSIRVRPPGWTEDHSVGDFFSTSRRHPGRDFCPVRRKDDVIVLATGEKVQPHVLETVLNEHEAVRAALAFGVGRFSIDNLWPGIIAARDKTDAPGRIWFKEQIILLKSGETLPRSAKGTVLREAAYEEYRKAIDQVYAPSAIFKAQIKSSGEAGEEDNLEARLLEYVARNLWNSYAPGLSVEQDLILLGMDSQQAAQLHRFIVSEAYRLPHRYINTAEIPRDLVYRYPSISRLSAYLRGDLTSAHDSCEALTLEKLVQQVVVPSMPELKEFEFGSTVLLTGGTGSLGGHLLAHLASISKVERIICLNRPGDGTEPYLRQVESNAKKGACITFVAAEKIQVIETDSTLPYLGLRPSTYMSLASSITHIIHNAFQVDFLRRSDQFKDQYAIMSNLIQLGLACSPRATFLFVSSVAVVGKCEVAPHSIDSPALIPEEAFQHDWNMPKSGYGVAKLACEKMLEGAFKEHGLYSIIVRCGQVSGALENGFWNSKEIFPTLFRNSRQVGALPDFDGTISWLPLEVTAATLTDILFSDAHSKQRFVVYHVENPHRQRWSDVAEVMSKEMGLPVVSHRIWLRDVRESEHVEPSVLGFDETGF